MLSQEIDQCLQGRPHLTPAGIVQEEAVDRGRGVSVENGDQFSCRKLGCDHFRGDLDEPNAIDGGPYLQGRGVGDKPPGNLDLNDPILDLEALGEKGTVRQANAEAVVGCKLRRRGRLAVLGNVAWRRRDDHLDRIAYSEGNHIAFKALARANACIVPARHISTSSFSTAISR